MSLFGTLGEFDPKEEAWEEYAERLTQFFVANQVDDAVRQRAIFITVVGASTYGLLKNLIAPVLPTQRTLPQLLETLRQHFVAPASEIVERFKFNSRAWKAGESVATFVAELRCLAKNCNYGATLDQMLRDRLVCGINDDAIQKKLLAERELTLARAIDIAVAMETTAKNALDLRGDNSTSEVLLLKRKGERSSYSASGVAKPKLPDSGISCYSCGEKGHRSSVCKFKRCVCHACGKTGHLARVCGAVGEGPGKKDRRTQVHQVEEYATPNEHSPIYDYTAPDEHNPVYDLFLVDTTQVSAPPPYKVCVSVQGVAMHEIQ